MAQPSANNSSHLIPSINRKLLEELDKIYPERAPRPGESLEALMVRAGQREVINYLWSQWEAQNKTEEETLRWAGS